MANMTSVAHGPRRQAWLRRDRTRLGWMALFVAVLHVVGWGLVVLVVAPRYGNATAGGFGIGLGVTAYVLGMRHAFDVDHIAAIDNTARKLIGDGRRPLAVGFWFSLGHSSVVFGLCLLIGLGVRALAAQVTDSSSQLQQITSLVGTLVSGCFLLLIGLINSRALLGVGRAFRRLRQGDHDEAELEAQLNSRGFIARILGRVTSSVRADWHMYPVGLLFGLGFDTATEVSLLVLSGSAAALQLPWYAVLTLPVLFAAGMSLLDTVDGVLISATYEWATTNPVRRVFYNLVVTGLSVAVAMVIGLIELLGLLGDKLSARSGPLAWAASINLDGVGYVVVALFLVTWLAGILTWKLGKFEHRWPQPQGAVRR